MLLRRATPDDHERAGEVTVAAYADFTRGPADVLDHATTDFAIGTKMGFDATHKLPGEGAKRGWPPLIRMDEAIRRKISGRD